MTHGLVTRGERKPAKGGLFRLFTREPLHDPLVPPDPQAVCEIKTTTCYMCACRCGIRVHLKDGELRYIDGNPNHPLNKGVICAKGASGIMKQVSPARLTRPLLRKAGSERGAGEFEPISWERALAMLTERLAKIRSTDPKKFGLFTGRDQMQALTGLFARQFGTPNYAAHGGFCSVNMAAGMIYTIGGSFWEFGGPDLDRAKLFVMIGTAEDHHSNPLKIALGKFKRGGGRFISINPVRTGYSAIADEWIPIKPGTDGALFMALLHELIHTDRIDRAFLKRFTNAPQLVVLDDGEREGLFAFDPDPAKGPPGDGREPHNKLVWDVPSQCVKAAYPEGIADGCDPALEGHYTLADGTRVAPSFQLLRERVESCTPDWAEAITGIPAERIVKLAEELGETALRHAFELPIPWTDAWGKQHPTTQARPVAFHAMRGLAAHSNGFQTVRALAVLYSSYSHLVARADAGISTIADLRGRVVSTGAAGSGTTVIARRILLAAGLDPSRDIREQSLGVAQSVDAIKDGKIDAFFWNGGLPTASILDLVNTPGVKTNFIATDTQLPRLEQMFGPSLYFRDTIPRATYNNDAEIAVVAVNNLLVASLEMSEALAHDITQVLFDQQAELAAIHPQAKTLSLKTAIAGSPVPFHPGAIRFYRERNAWTAP